MPTETILSMVSIALIIACVIMVIGFIAWLTTILD